MLSIKSLLQQNAKNIYIYFTYEEISKEFLIDAEKEGFTFGDGVKPTQRHPSDIFSIHDDMTISYVGFCGHMAFHYSQSTSKNKFLKVNYHLYKYGI